MTPGLFRLFLGAFTFLDDNIFSVFLIILVPCLAVDFLLFLSIGFGRLGTSSSMATSSFVNLVPELSFSFFKI